MSSECDFTIEVFGYADEIGVVCGTHREALRCKSTSPDGWERIARWIAYGHTQTLAASA